MSIYFYYGLSMFLGGPVQWIVPKMYPKIDRIYTTPVASGSSLGRA